jgi:hypothetical protein
LEEVASRRQSRRSARIWKGFLGENEKDLSIKIWFEPICFQVLWQFGMFSASPFILPARQFRAALCAARSEFRSS